MFDSLLEKAGEQYKAEHGAGQKNNADDGVKYSLNTQFSQDVQTWFESCIIRNYANPRIEQSIMISDDDKFKAAFIHALNDMGIDITDYYYDKDEQQIFLSRTVNNDELKLKFTVESDEAIALYYIAVYQQKDKQEWSTVTVHLT